MYVVSARAECRGVYRLIARPFQHQGDELSTKALKAAAFLKSLKALNVLEAQISAIRKSLENGGEVHIGADGLATVRSFAAPDLVAAGFEAANT